MKCFEKKTFQNKSLVGHLRRTDSGVSYEIPLINEIGLRIICLIKSNWDVSILLSKQITELPEAL